MIRSNACWFPGLFLLNDFTVPGGAIKQGRRQEPCYTRYHPSRYQTPSRACLPSSFGPRFRKREQQTRFPGSLIATTGRYELFHV
jgi:hypothetical protein